MSKRNVVASGCSFSAWTSGNAFYDAWPYHINKEDISLHNVSISGSGNDIIALNTIVMVEDLLKQGFESKDIFVLVQWTGMFRPTIFDPNVKKRQVPFHQITAEHPLKKIKYPGFAEPAAYKQSEYWEPYFSKYFPPGHATMQTLKCILEVQWYLKSMIVDEEYETDDI